MSYCRFPISGLFISTLAYVSSFSSALDERSCQLLLSQVHSDMKGISLSRPLTFFSKATCITLSWKTDRLHTNSILLRGMLASNLDPHHRPAVYNINWDYWRNNGLCLHTNTHDWSDGHRTLSFNQSLVSKIGISWLMVPNGIILLTLNCMNRRQFHRVYVLAVLVYSWMT